MEIDGAFFWIQAQCDVFGKYSFYRRTQITRSGVGGKAVIIGDEKIGIELFLQFEEILKGTKVIAKVQFAGRTNPTHHHFFHKYKITKIAGDLDEKPMKG